MHTWTPEFEWWFFFSFSAAATAILWELQRDPNLVYPEGKPAHLFPWNGMQRGLPVAGIVPVRQQKHQEVQSKGSCPWLLGYPPGLPRERLGLSGSKTEMCVAGLDR